MLPAYILNLVLLPWQYLQPSNMLAPSRWRSLACLNDMSLPRVYFLYSHDTSASFLCTSTLANPLPVVDIQAFLWTRTTGGRQYASMPYIPPKAFGSDVLISTNVCYSCAPRAAHIASSLSSIIIFPYPAAVAVRREQQNMAWLTLYQRQRS